MKKCLPMLLLFCVLASSSPARHKKAAADQGAGTPAEKIGSPAGPAAPQISPEVADVVLKDGQSLKGSVLGYDSYFLDVKSRQGTTFHIPWPEVKSVGQAGKTEDWAQAFLTPEQNLVVTTTVTPLSGGQALRAALFPGILLHGWGHYQARDTDRFYALMGAEVFGLMVGTFGVTEMSGPIFFKPNPQVPGENDDTARVLAFGGAAVFAGSWLWDVAFASSAADRFNREHGLALQVAPGNNGTMMAGLNYRF